MIFQVTPTEMGEDWITGRAWPACYYLQQIDSDAIVVVGGDIKALGKTVDAAACSAAVAIHLAPSYENKALQEVSEKELKARLKRYSGKHYISTFSMTFKFGPWWRDLKRLPVPDCNHAEAMDPKIW